MTRAMARGGPRTALAFLALSVAVALAPPAQRSDASDAPDFAVVLQTHAQQLATVTSDAEALTLFTTRLGQALALKDSVVALARKVPGGQSGQDSTAVLTEHAVALTAELSAWRLAVSFIQSADSTDPGLLQTTVQQAAAQQRWLLSGDRRPHLRRTLVLGATLAAMQPAQPRTDAPPAGYADYVAALDKAYPSLTGFEASWLAIAEREGAAGLRQRLLDGATRMGLSDADTEIFTGLYVQTHLRPPLRAHLMALAIRAEADAERQTRDAWQRVATWQDRLKELRNLARLCGTWQWTVHNHKNHSEHKAVLVFPPPDSPETTSGPRPSKVVVLGDAVYLRWDVPGGYQEDSLLFIKGGRQLEGSFMNTAGEWGAIAGKRTAPCVK